ncbi:unnamed protein product [Toxocara canis]|uniref:ABC transporter ATP-binding protein n=1 Tax=Toxocara canis TaxID=6265 RepID=A0A183V3U9_TOXCA|nr:unnamed protein product [Toxocara canis]
MSCRRWYARPFRFPTYPPLPAVRTVPGKSFADVGLDYFGQIRVKRKSAEEMAKGGTKRRIALFRCP